MDERVFIVVALVIGLALIAGLYFVLDLLNQRVLGLASEARGREQIEMVNRERLARALNGLVDEVTVLTDALKTERVARSDADAQGRKPAKNAAAAEAETVEHDRAPDEEATRIMSKDDAGPLRPTRITPTRVSPQGAAR